MLKKGLFALALLAVIAIAVWYFKVDRSDGTPEVGTVALSRGEITQVVTASGTIQPVTTVEVSSQISGLVNQVLVDYNTPVKKGDVLARIDPATYQQRLRQAQADLAAAKANERMVAINADRTRELFKKQWVTQQDLDQADATLEQARATVMTKEATLEGAKVDLGRCTIYSPIDGIVMDRQVDVGKTVAASLNAPTLFIIANQLSDMEIDAAVAEADIGNVSEAQPVDFTVDAYPNRHFRGKVTQVRNNPKTANNVVTYDTMIGVRNDDLKLKSGMTANVSIVVAEHKNALRIPNSALRARVPEELIVSKTQSGSSASSMTPEEHRRQVWQILRDAGYSRESGPPSPEVIQRIEALAKEKGIEIDVSRFTGAKSGAHTTASVTRTVYRLLPSQDPKKPRIEAVSVKLGITDGVYTEVLSGLNDKDTIVSSVTMPASSQGASANPMNPFSGRRMR